MDFKIPILETMKTIPYYQTFDNLKLVELENWFLQNDNVYFRWTFKGKIQPYNQNLIRSTLRI